MGIIEAPVDVDVVVFEDVPAKEDRVGHVTPIFDAGHDDVRVAVNAYH